MTVGDVDIGPIEVEVLFVIMFSAAGYFGVGAMDKPINQYITP